MEKAIAGHFNFKDKCSKKHSGFDYFILFEYFKC